MFPWILIFVGAVVFFSAISAPSIAITQDFSGIGTTQRGRTSDGTARATARDLVEHLEIRCRVVSAVLIGRDVSGGTHYEVACGDGPGHILVDGPSKQGVDCLTLENLYASNGADRQSPRCRLPGSRNAIPVVSPLAQSSGLRCRIDEAALVGRNSTFGAIYEAGCAGEAGGWLEQAGDGWVVTDCMVLQARGAECRFTSEAEILGQVRAWLNSAGRPECRPVRARFKGLGADGAFYETSCSDGAGWMIRHARQGEDIEAISCEAAKWIGGGCTPATEVRSQPRP